jgi:hypothetical protein
MRWLPGPFAQGLEKKLESLSIVLANNGKKAPWFGLFLPEVYSASFNGDSGSPFQLE